MNKPTLIAAMVLCLFMFQGCAGKKAPNPIEATADDAAVEESYPDSAEKMNRSIFRINDGIITYMIKPVNTVYTGVFPPDVRNGFGNFFRNLAYPVRVVNALLQFKFDKVGKETGAFALNTVFGVGGLFNVTKNMPCLQSSPEDFGQTLAYYGVGSGTYLVLPLLGSSTVRDTVGLVADALLNPVTWVTPDEARYALSGSDKFTSASANLPTYDSIKAESFDHYASMRDVYFQHRNSLEAQ